ncbi:aldose epimerase [Bacillus sp. SA1-12]|uniref:aldose epimerase family protein n=1 Tax=Bacillus sp. SA1-12 TaxID=1455638 RepID=UPI00062742E4|nr:aldose epimerase family protein [Bacillus sp. SA1-12]KKI90206.1 aldose epimerase [Bacillus sp. SA1-12]
MRVVKVQFGEYKGEEVYSYSLQNKDGMKVTCINLGCIITEILTPNKEGQFENVVLGFDDVENYLENSPYFGAVVGRVAGRIKNGSFELDGETYQLPQNENANHLHGGLEGFDRKLWEAEPFETDGGTGIEFNYISKDGEEGYPGTLTVKVTYLLTDQNELIVTYAATTDKKTLVNLTNHTYFNLSGNIKNDILSHKLKINSKKFLELNEDFIPTGTFLDVENTPFDFLKEKELREAILADHKQVQLVGQGIDHPFLLDDDQKKEIILLDEESGRKLIVETEEQSVVVYTSNMLGDFRIRDVQARKYLGICLETQGLPDSIHHPQFSPCILDAGDEYKTTTKFIFTIN